MSGQLDEAPPFRAVILDMDGLMLDTEILEFRAWQRAARKFSWTISAEQYLQLTGKTVNGSWRRGVPAKLGLSTAAGGHGPAFTATGVLPVRRPAP